MKRLLALIIICLLFAIPAFAEDDCCNTCKQLQQLEKEFYYLQGTQAGVFCVTQKSNQTTKEIVECIMKMKAIYFKIDESEKSK